MKKWMLMVLAVLLLLLPTACGEKEEAVDNTKKETAVAEETGYRQGQWEDRHYVSEFLSLSVTVPEDWGAMGTKQLLSTMGVEVQEGQSYADAVKDLNVVYDAILYRENDSVLIQCQKAKEVDADTAVQKLCEQYVSGQKEECTVSELKDRKLCGESYRFATVVGKETGKIVGFAVRTVNKDYAAVIILNGEKQINDCLKLFDK